MWKQGYFSRGQDYNILAVDKDEYCSGKKKEEDKGWEE